MSDTVYFATGRVALGATQVAAHDSLWSEWNETASELVLTFPRRAFVVEPEGRAAEVLHAGIAVLAQPARPYRRTRLDPRGEHTEWLWLERDVLERFAKDSSGWDPSSRWLRTVDGSTWMEQRALVRCARSQPTPDEFEERAYSFVASLFNLRPPETETSRRAVRVVIEELALREGIVPTLNALAETALVTPSHLCVAFKQATGRTITSYARQLRLFAALAKLEGGDMGSGRLVDLALDFGFSSHSHFSSRFRDEFGVTPREARKILGRDRTE